MSIMSQKEQRPFVEPISNVERVDNASTINNSIRKAAKMMLECDKLMKKYNLRYQSLDMWLKIADNWNNENKSSTLYYLSAGNTGNIVVMHKKVLRLKAKGLIEVIGHGRFGRYAYGPTRLGIEALKPLCEVA